MMHEHCGILEARSEVLGDNGGCDRNADYHCAQCGMPVCMWHTWSKRRRFVCAVCYGISGYERDPQAMQLTEPITPLQPIALQMDGPHDEVCPVCHGSGVTGSVPMCYKCGRMPGERW